MEKRRFGRTNHMSTLAIFGAVALGQINQTRADQVVQNVIDAGINHIDIAASYGDAELRLGPWMPKIRKDFFLGCKTMQRDEKGVIEEFNQSLKRLQVEYFDLYQLHAVNTMEDLDICTSQGGALDGIRKMRDAGLTKFIGITGHGLNAPQVFIEALARLEFDSVLFPINPALFKNDAYREHALRLLDLCEEKDVGVMIIKSVAKKPWGDEEHRYHTWYAPFDDAESIQKNVHFALSQKLAHICTPGDYRLLDLVFDACESFEPLKQGEQEALIKAQSDLELIF